MANGMHQLCCAVSIAAHLLLWSSTLLGQVRADIPHINECNFCKTCYYDKSKDPSARPPSIDFKQYSQSAKSNAERIMPTLADREAKQVKPNCTECWGCTTQLQPLKAITAFGHDFSVELGASPEWLFFADLPDTHITGRRAIVKVWCLPIDKVSGQFKWQCQNGALAIKATQHIVALDAVTEECGLTDISIRAWIAPVNAVVPGLGLHIWWYGLWMEKAEGLSLNQLSYVGKRDLVENMVLDLLQVKLNKTRVVRAAIFDLLSSQCDRHSQNVFIDEQGNLKLIDNLNSLTLAWEHCAVDSLFLPGTQKHAIIVYGGNIVSKRLNTKMRRSTNPMVLLDYRCYMPNGEIGKNYDPQLAQCLSKIGGMSAGDAISTYGFTDTRTAQALIDRAKDMSEKGFEWALRMGKPLNKGPMRYRWHQPCCKLAVESRTGIVCGHPWTRTPEFPKGDPSRGGPWLHNYPDPGTYDGDKIWQR